jgi:hypothetical protein
MEVLGLIWVDILSTSIQNNVVLLKSYICVVGLPSNFSILAVITSALFEMLGCRIKLGKLISGIYKSKL